MFPSILRDAILDVQPVVPLSPGPGKPCRSCAPVWPRLAGKSNVSAMRIDCRARCACYARPRGDPFRPRVPNMQYCAKSDIKAVSNRGVLTSE